MKIPAVREELEDLALQLKAQEGRNWKTVARKMEGLVPELKRRSPKRRAKVKNAEGRKRNPLSREQKQEIALFAKTHPDWMLQEIGTKFGVNQGRVSEIIAGFRK
jgi:transposase